LCLIFNVSKHNFSYSSRITWYVKNAAMVLKGALKSKFMLLSDSGRIELDLKKVDATVSIFKTKVY